VDRARERHDVERRQFQRRRHGFAAGLLIGCMLAAASASFAAVQVGQVAPDFRLPLLTGKEISLSQFKGRPIVLDFWDSS
jgi:cytochrome oxidase Cu insertion factor (SCO1/SenC/PrrC family)